MPTGLSGGSYDFTQFNRPGYPPRNTGPSQTYQGPEGWSTQGGTFGARYTPTWKDAQSAARGTRGVRGSTSYTDPSTGISYRYNSVPTFNWDAWAKFGGGGKGPDVAGPAAPDTTAAEAAAFARAKERIGLSTQGAIKSLKNIFAGRGLAGSGLEGEKLAGAAGGGQQQIGETIRDQAIQGLKRQQDVADMTYQGRLQMAMAKYQAEMQQKNAILQAMLSGGVMF